MYSRCKLAGVLTSRQLELLTTLSQLQDQLGECRFWRPKELGGFRGSHHAKTLAALAEEGLVAQLAIHAGSRAHYLYALTDKGLRALRQVRMCAGVAAPHVLGRKADQDRARFLAQFMAHVDWAAGPVAPAAIRPPALIPRLS